MKDPKNPNRWTNVEISESPQGYRDAQRAHKADQERRRAERGEQQDRERFEAEFVAAGGTKSGAEAAWRRERDEGAAEAARRADDTARGVQRGATMGVI